jgi:hypothetical protein
MSADLLKAPPPSADDRKNKAASNYFWANKIAEFPSASWIVMGDPAPWDWVATISYYSAIHYLLYHLQKNNPSIRYFQESRRISNIDEYMREFNCPSFHSAYKKIVSHNFKQIKTAWEFLFNTADSARYNSQVVPVASAQKSLAYLNDVKNLFDK